MVAPSRFESNGSFRFYQKFDFAKSDGDLMTFPYTIIDLTHTLDENIPSWNGGCGFQCEITSDYSDSTTEAKFRTQQWTMRAGMGTHVDAPAHCIPGAPSIDQIPLSQLCVPCIMMDVSAASHEHYSVSLQDIAQFENKYGRILAGTFVMIKTGWERFWHIPGKYHNNYLFPSVSIEAAELLVNRGVCGLGIDTLSPDRPESGYPVHQLFLGKGKYLVENAANLDSLPAQGGFILILPMKIKGATEAPIRLVALVE
jgi:kynurenine formamidase